MPQRDTEILEKVFLLHKLAQTDMSLQMDVLVDYVCRYDCNHVTEFGSHPGNSTIAFMYAFSKKWAGEKGLLVSYDLIEPTTQMRKLYGVLEPANLKWEFCVDNTRFGMLESTDLLLIDTYHTYEQLREELKSSAGGVRKFILIHDTSSYGKEGEDGTVPGLKKAISDFLTTQQGHNWQVWKEHPEGSGLTALARKANVE